MFQKKFTYKKSTDDGLNGHSKSVMVQHCTLSNIFQNLKSLKHQQKQKIYHKTYFYLKLSLIAFNKIYEFFFFCLHMGHEWSITKKKKNFVNLCVPSQEKGDSPQTLGFCFSQMISHWTDSIT